MGPVLLHRPEFSAPASVASRQRRTFRPTPPQVQRTTDLSPADLSLGKPSPKATRVPTGTAEHHSALKQHLEWPRKGARGAKTRALAIFGGAVSFHRQSEVWHGLKTGKEACVFASFARFCGKLTAYFRKLTPKPRPCLQFQRSSFQLFNPGAVSGTA